MQEGRVDQKIMAFLAKGLLISSISDFANFWTASECEAGMQDDVMTTFFPGSGMTTASSRLQVSRLRAAWRATQSKALEIAASSPAKPHLQETVAFVKRQA